MNLANRITISRILLMPVFVLAILYKQLNIAFIVFLLASLTDALDGYIARMRKEVTILGTIMDPLADKLLVGSAFISFSIVSGLPEHLRMPVYVPFIIVTRDVLILLGALIVYVLQGNVDVKPTMLGKLTTVFQLSTIVALLVRFTFSGYLWNITVVLTIISGLDYLRIGAGQINGKG